ncbi:MULTISPECIES: adenosylmethionine decarboxylase [Chryseobacterium]|uniref:S-adenosylmethionine decarboxylase n=1 Tax=Chryseobacterium taihuense TaxID=1141221 RepID=A0A1G9LU70_9FLAO|nr:MULTISPECIES: adenosylmethionine decarboxylase [Chryseobacterium]QQV01597.1 adenosylmethionine decarboxylase [Chryseobacterium sp. FDAARGOS 1104]SDL65652.1 S-adenosylmethionine decarboxylase [Chryseobacterium taihuense]VFB05206.1 S-adenosylmethionine decarboxylase proenzyme precursor [Chryseobacterium taihuense]
MTSDYHNIGYHTIWDIYGCNIQKSSFVPEIKEILNKVVEELNLGKVQEAYKQFHPFGATGFILLEESHISIHTWPEKEFAAIDVFSCKPFDTEKINSILKDFFETNEINTKVITRGELTRIKTASPT